MISSRPSSLGVFLRSKLHTMHSLHVVLKVIQGCQKVTKMLALRMVAYKPSFRLMSQIGFLYMIHHVGHPTECAHAASIGKLLVTDTIDTLPLFEHQRNFCWLWR